MGWREGEADTDAQASKSTRQSGNKSTSCNLPLVARNIMQDFLETFPEIAVCASSGTGARSWHVGNA
jgi:hypothetical protein